MLLTSFNPQAILLKSHAWLRALAPGGAKEGKNTASLFHTTSKEGKPYHGRLSVQRIAEAIRKEQFAMKKFGALLLFACCAQLSLAQEAENTRLKESYNVLKEIQDSPDKGIPADLLNKAECVVIFPSVKKAAFLVGGSYGRGAVTCRSGADFRGPWSAPAMYALEGASFGLQIGGEATDFVLLVMNEKGASSIMTSKVKLGADASAAAGPVGRTVSAETDAVMKAEILSYSRARGVFGGVSLEGSTLRSDDGANKNLYGQKLTATQIVREGKVTTPEAAKPLIQFLQTVSPTHGSKG
jgi:lipid-binding SYLF domain-containing protein